MENRGKDYYAMNAIDLAAFVNELNLRGHKEATLITTRDKGYLPDGTRHPHTWETERRGRSNVQREKLIILRTTSSFQAQLLLAPPMMGLAGRGVGAYTLWVNETSLC